MYSYPNLIRLRRIVKAVEPFGFERVYGAWWGKVVLAGAKAAVARSGERYVRAIHTRSAISRSRAVSGVAGIFCPQLSHFTIDKICGIIDPDRMGAVSVDLSTASDYEIDPSMISAFFSDFR